MLLSVSLNAFPEFLHCFETYLRVLDFGDLTLTPPRLPTTMGSDLFVRLLW